MNRLGMALAMLAWSSWTATAQDRLVVGSREVGAIGHFGADLAPAPALVQYPRFGGDRYVHVPGRGIHDVRTGAILPMPSGFALAYDRARPRVFVGRPDGIWGVDVVTGFTTLAIARAVFDVTTCVHATSADVLLCAFARPDGQRDIVRSGPTGAVMIATTRFGNPLDDRWLATPDGSRVYLDHCRLAAGAPPGTCVERGIAVIEVATGTISTAGRIDVLADAGLVWDEVNDRLFVVSDRVDVYAHDLVPIGSAVTGGRCNDLAISSHTGRIYLNVLYRDSLRFWSTLSVYDAGRLRKLEEGDRRSSWDCGIQVLTAPGAPRDLRASVAGRNVTLTWTNIGAASNFVLDVGVAPGRTDLSLHLGSTPFAIFQGVPPGTYYLRLRGGNIHGGGRPSEEVAVTVR